MSFQFSADANEPYWIGQSDKHLQEADGLSDGERDMLCKRRTEWFLLLLVLLLLLPGQFGAGGCVVVAGYGENTDASSRCLQQGEQRGEERRNKN